VQASWRFAGPLGYRRAMRNRDGRSYRSAGDLPLMLPALEMAGRERVAFVRERACAYNRGTPHGENAVCGREQRAMGLEICRRRSYAVRDDL